jgi:hypothetical protein
LNTGGRVERAGGVAEKRPGASGRVAVSGVSKQRPSASGRAELAGDVASERQETNSSVEPAGG